MAAKTTVSRSSDPAAKEPNSSRPRISAGAAPMPVPDLTQIPVDCDAEYPSNSPTITNAHPRALLRRPRQGTKAIKVHIPAELTKNEATIEFPIRSNRYGCRDTIRWYRDVVRPLFRHAETSLYLFPAVKISGAHLDPDFFGAEFAGLMRTVVNLPMTPHQMRHGRTSLLLDKHPNEVEVIAKRIDDAPDTLRQFYGWLNSMKLVERGQDLLVGLMET